MMLRLLYHPHVLSGDPQQQRLRTDVLEAPSWTRPTRSSGAAAARRLQRQPPEWTLVQRVLLLSPLWLRPQAGLRIRVWEATTRCGGT